MSLTDSQIRNLKARFGPVFAVEVAGRRFICRTITRQEAALVGYLQSDEVPPEAMEAVFQLAVIDPEEAYDDETIDAGSIRFVVMAVLEKSGLTSVDGIQRQVELARERQTVYHEIAAVICAAFPTLLPGQLDTLPIDQLMDLLVIAENVLIIQGLANKGLMAPIDFTEAEGKAEAGTVTFEDDDLARKLHEGAQEAARQYLQ